MELAEQIRKKFANLSVDNASLLNGFESKDSSWTIRFKNSYAVGIEIDSHIKINESFANVSYYTEEFTIENEKKYLLLLSSTDESLRNEFAGICALFLELGSEGSNREQLKKEPIKWWFNWKNLIGNRSVDTTIHGVLGELIVLYYLKRHTHNDISIDNWTGPAGKSVDIRTKEYNYEVKTSLIKYNNIVTISGQFQLETYNKMSLIFVKLEELGVVTEGINIINIDSMIEKLSDLGMDAQKLSLNVSGLGFKENSEDRKKNFRILEIKDYPVNDNFPLITLDSLSDVSNKDLILQLNYKINLSSLDCKDLDLVIK